MKKDVKPTSVRLPSDIKKKLEEMAEREGRSFNNLINLLLKRAVSE